MELKEKYMEPTFESEMPLNFPMLYYVLYNYINI